MDAIVGFGLAGSTIAARQPSRPWVIIDPVAPADDPRTFACWAHGPHPMDAVTYRSWDRVQIVTDEVVTVDVRPYRYLAFRMGAWREHVARALTQATFVHDAVRSIDDGPYGAQLHLRDSTVAARFVFDSRFSPSALQLGAGEVLLWQSFRGARVVAERDVFDPDTPILMDFRARGPGIAFGYVLPEDPRRALVECVGIGPHPTRVDLDGYLRDVLGVARWVVEVEEAGATPMTDHRFARRRGDRVLAVGIHGGRLKPSTGYGVGRMLRDAAAIERSLALHGHPFEVAADPATFAWLDAVLLRVLRDRPGLAPQIFHRLFAGNPGPRVLRFLDEQASPAECAAIAAALPLGPFLAASAG